ncbi:hypothetical protein C2S53_017511 [Perilla frutescens var. hirtella]|uniref:CCHC-type domain-containing protein n=1 Tax=Perilla frutescens var. hirtella TaxID=608512 RepID=A0AAD4IT99_PERFH|nr:hypothetical protein C2S53_017511 [Perilla frutescens var. hirtella]
MEGLSAAEVGEIDLDSLVVASPEEEVESSFCMIGRLVTDKALNSFPSRSAKKGMETMWETIYLHFKVVVDISKPILQGLTPKLDGERLWIPLKHESIPLFCFNCGIVGHQIKLCPNVAKKSYDKLGDVPYGASSQHHPSQTCTTSFDPSPTRLSQTPQITEHNINHPSQSFSYLSPLKVECWSRSKNSTRPIGSPKLSLSLSKRPNGLEVIDNDFELYQVFKKLKDTELVDVLCTGLKNPEAVHALKWKLRHKFPELIFLMETKLLRCEEERLARELRFEEFFSVDCVTDGRGDFNEIHYYHEKSGGIGHDYGKIEDFRKAVHECRLEDLGFKGFKFTWSNCREGEKNMQECLDRFLTSELWIEQFPNSKGDWKSVEKHCWMKRNQIRKIELENGVVLESEMGIQKAFRDYFGELFTSKADINPKF